MCLKGMTAVQSAWIKYKFSADTLDMFLRILKNDSNSKHNSLSITFTFSCKLVTLNVLQGTTIRRIT